MLIVLTRKCALYYLFVPGADPQGVPTLRPLGDERFLAIVEWVETHLGVKLRPPSPIGTAKAVGRIQLFAPEKTSGSGRHIIMPDRAEGVKYYGKSASTLAMQM